MDTTKENALREQGADTNANTPKFYPKKRATAVIVLLAMRGLIPAGFATRRAGVRGAHE